ncbi:hypothetical protein ACTFIW_003881 [Dictyostelium discoideum]
MISKIFSKQSIFAIFVICLFIFILNNNIIDTKLKEKHTKEQNNNNNKNNNNKNNNKNNNNNNNNNKNNKKSNVKKNSYNSFRNINFLNEEFPQLYTYNPEEQNIEAYYYEEEEEEEVEVEEEEEEEEDNYQDKNKLKIFNNEIKEEWSKLPSDIMDKKRICIVTTEIEGPVLGGGIGTAYTALSQKLNEDGHQITIVLVNKVKRLTMEHWIELYGRQGIELVILDFFLLDPLSVGSKVAMENQNKLNPPNETDNLIGIIGCTGPCIRSYRTYLWLSRHENQFDFIHFHDNGGMAYFSTLSQRQGLHFQEVNIVIGGHGPHLWERIANSANLDDGKHFEVDYLERKSVQFSNYLISPSNYMLNWMTYNRWEIPINSFVHQNLLPGKNQQSLSPMLLNDFLFKQQQQQQDINTDDDDDNNGLELHDFNEILFFGRLESRKGLDIFLKALESLSQQIKSYSMKITFLGSNTKLMEFNVMADLYIDSVCRRLDIHCQILVGKSHTEAIQYLTTNKNDKLVVVASPIDNSPNTVLECLTHRLSLIATNVGGIPELIHPNDRKRVLFDPKPKSLAKLIKTLKETGISAARFSTDEWTRQMIWSNWHSIAQLDRSITNRNRKLNSVRLDNIKKKLLTIVLIYDRSNLETLLKNINSISSQQSPYFNYNILIAKSSMIPGGSTDKISPKLSKLLKSLNIFYLVTEINHSLLQPFQPWNSKEILEHSTGDNILFLDPLDYLSSNALYLLGRVDQFTNAQIITGSVLFSGNNSIIIDKVFDQINKNIGTTTTTTTTTTTSSTTTSSSSSLDHSPETSITSIYMGCTGMPGIMYNCYGSSNLLISRLALQELSNQYPVLKKNDSANNDHFDHLDFNSDIENSGTWDFYAHATSNGYSLQTIPKVLFISDRLEYEPQITYSQETRVLKNFDNILPPTFELSSLATRHFLTTKKLYLNEIINVNTKSKECERLLNSGGNINNNNINSNNNNNNNQELIKISNDNFNENGEENHMESRNHIKMLFVRGHEKSGTSWLKKVIDLHPRIFMAKQEFHFSIMEEGLDKFTSKPWAASQEPYKSYSRKWYRSFVRNILLSGVSPSLAPLINWIGEKTPSPLAPIISGSRYILIVRDGRDVVISLFWHYVRLGGFENWCGPNQHHLVNPDYVKEYRADNGTKDYFSIYPERLLEKEICFRKIASGWAKRVREDQSVIDALQSNPVASVFSLRYEELHKNPEENRKALYQFLDLDYNEAEPLSVEDKTIPGGFDEKSDKNKFFRKGEIGDWRNYFTDDNKRWFKEETGSLLIDLGYELNNDWQ